MNRQEAERAAINVLHDRGLLSDGEPALVTGIVLDAIGYDALVVERDALMAGNERLREALQRIRHEIVVHPEDAGPYFKAVAAAALAEER